MGSEQVDVALLNCTSGEALAKYRLCRQTAAKTVSYCDAGEMPLGRVPYYVASGGGLAVDLLDQKQGTIRLMASGAISALADVFTDDDGKVTATNTGVKVGQALEAATTDGDIVEVLPCVERVPYVNTAASAVIGPSSTAEADFDKTFTIPASEIKAGSIFRIRAMATVTDQDTTPQFAFKLYAGTEVLATVTVAAAADNDSLFLDCLVVIRTIGATGTLIASVAAILDASGTAITSVPKAQATEDTTGGLTIKASGTFNASHADNKAQLEILMVEHVR